MTDSSHDTSSTAATGDQASAKATSKAERKPAKRRSALGIAFVLVLVLAIALGGAAWYLYQQQQTQQAQMAAQIQQSAGSSSQAVNQVQAMRAQVEMDQGRLQQLETQLERAREQIDGLEQALQMLTANGGELALLNDVDQLVEIAQQQLTLGGNVANAIIALETAQARLARAAMPALVPLQQAVNGDLARLRAVPAADTAHLQAKLDELSSLVGNAPLLVRDKGVAAEADDATSTPAYVAEEAAPEASWWEKAWASTRNTVGEGWHLVSQDLSGLLSVRRIDDSSALLISADQAGQLRDNLRLRLMTAKLALMMRQSDIWQSEVQAVETLIQARYDLKTVEGKRSLLLASQLSEAEIAVALPDTLNSREAAQTIREERASKEAAAPLNEPAVTEEGATEGETPAQAPATSSDAAPTEQDALPATPENSESPADEATSGTNAAITTDRVAS